MDSVKIETIPPSPGSKGAKEQYRWELRTDGEVVSNGPIRSTLDAAIKDWQRAVRVLQTAPLVAPDHSELDPHTVKVGPSAARAADSLRQAKGDLAEALGAGTKSTLPAEVDDILGRFAALVATHPQGLG